MRKHKVITWYSPVEEKLNIYSHGLGAFLSAIAIVLLTIKGFNSSTNNIFALLCYGVSMLLLYSASTLYHSAKTDVRRRFLNIVDHAAIYLLIAGTYTPFCLITLPSDTGIPLLIAVWTFALVGIVLKLFFTGRFNIISTLLYVAMGWMVVFAYRDVVDNLASQGLYLLAAGGFAYTQGAVLYSIKKIPFNHAIFHFFVLLGSLFHFLSIYLYVA